MDPGDVLVIFTDGLAIDEDLDSADLAGGTEAHGHVDVLVLADHLVDDEPVPGRRAPGVEPCIAHARIGGLLDRLFLLRGQFDVHRLQRLARIDQLLRLLDAEVGFRAHQRPQAQAATSTALRASQFPSKSTEPVFLLPLNGSQ